MSVITETAKALKLRPYQRYDWTLAFENSNHTFSNMTMKEAIAAATATIESKPRFKATTWDVNPAGRCMGRRMTASIIVTYRHPRYRVLNGATLRPAHVPSFV